MEEKLEKLNDRLRAIEIRLYTLLGGGTVLFLACLSFFGYQKWIDVPNKVRDEFKKQISQERLETLDRAAEDAEKVINLWKQVSEKSALKSEENQPLHLMAGDALLTMDNTTQNPDSEKAVDVRVKFEEELPEVPRVFVAITGRTGFWQTIGFDCIHELSSTGFKVSISHRQEEVTPELVSEKEWKLMWIAIYNPTAEPVPTK